MKVTKYKYVILSLFAVMLCSFSCEGPEEMASLDFSPVELKLYVMNDEGYNLFDAKTENNLLSNDIKAINNGAAYPLNTDYVEEEHEVSPVSAATFYGLKLKRDKTGETYVSIGEFEGGKSFDNEIVTIDWGDGTYNTIKFDSRVSWWKSEPIIHRFYFLDKETVNNPMTLYKRKIAVEESK